MVDNTLFAQLLRALGEQELISQTQDGQLVLGIKGENLVEHYSFYTAFNTPEEYRLECDGRSLGTLPIDKPLVKEQHIIFAGRRWEVVHIDAENKLITLKKAKGGRPPKFGGEGQTVHDIVRKEMFNIYREGTEPIYLDSRAKSVFSEGVECFRSLGLENRQIIEKGNTVTVLPWVGDKVVNTITALLRGQGLLADCFAGVIDIRNTSIQEFYDAVGNILIASRPTASGLARDIPDTIIEKHDPFLPKELRDVGYGARFYDVEGAWDWLKNAKR